MCGRRLICASCGKTALCRTLRCAAASLSSVRLNGAYGVRACGAHRVPCVPTAFLPGALIVGAYVDGKLRVCPERAARPVMELALHTRAITAMDAHADCVLWACRTRPAV